MIAVKVGKKGRKIHAGRFVQSYTNLRGQRVDLYDSLCTVVNSHNVNNHPQVIKMPEGTAITCSNCARMAEEAGKHDRS